MRNEVGVDSRSEFGTVEDETARWSRPTTAYADGLGDLARLPLFGTRFRLLERLGQGGMGVVLRAFDHVLRREVALKTLNAPGPDDLYRLKREFRLLADLRHPNLVHLEELFVTEASAFFTMELLEGCSVQRFIHPTGESGTCDYGRLRNAARQLALALAAVHAAGKVHRDVKPSNLMVTWAGRVVLFDFGLATSLSPKSAKTLRTGAPLGTRGYHSPEQSRGEGLTPAADWYSFAVTLFEAATGRPPNAAAAQAHTPGKDVHLRTYLPDAPTDLDELVASLLHPLPERRPGAIDVLLALEGSHVARSGRPSTGCAELRGRAENRRGTAPALVQALDAVQRGRPAIVYLRSRSSAEKTTIASEFVDEAQKLGALVLRGRCRPRERVPFNAMDEVVDDLSHVLGHLPYRELVSILPAHVSALPSLFPVLGRLEATSEDGFRPRSARRDCTIGRARIALKDLLASLAKRRRLIVWIDDAEWGDAESGALLKELLEAPGAPPLLLVVGYRSEEGSGGSALSVLRQIGGNARTFDVIVEPADQGHAEPGPRESLADSPDAERCA